MTAKRLVKTFCWQPLLGPHLSDDKADWKAPVGEPCPSELPYALLRFPSVRWAQATEDQLAGVHSHPQAPPLCREVGYAVLSLSARTAGAWPAVTQAMFAYEDPVVLRDHCVATLCSEAS